MGTVVALAGQIGGAKLADGLYRLRGKDLAIIANTGDDYEQFGLSFSPDIDTLLYTLSGIASDSAGWEPAGETRAVFEMIRTLGGPDRPVLGDRGLAAPILRADGLRSERNLSEITREFCQHLGITARILPMSDDRIRTHVVTEDGVVTFPDYFTQLSCEPEVRGFEYLGAAGARIPDDIMDALHSDDLEAVVICPANPYHVIQPILAIDGMREMLRRRGAPVIAVSPIIGGRALKGSAAKMMRELGREMSSRAIAMEYYQLIDGLMIDEEDAALVEGIAAGGIAVTAKPTIMRTVEDRVALAAAVLDFARELREARVAADAAAP